MSFCEEDHGADLGIPGAPICPDELICPGDSTIGHIPVLINKITNATIICDICSKTMYFVCQFENSFSSDIIRMIYIFCCNTRRCSQNSKGWKVFIQIKPLTKATNTDHDKTCFEASSNNIWYSLMTEDKTDHILSDFISEKMSSLSINASSNCLSFPGYHLNFVEEIETPNLPSKHELELQKKIMNEYDPHQEADDLESTLLNFDKFSLKFQKRVSSYPGQCLRISNTPLFFSQPAHFECFVCSECGREKLFEFQLMPAILSMLPTESAEYLKHLDKISSHRYVSNGMDWVTVLFYSCPSCLDKEHSVLIQIEQEFAVFE